MKKKLIIAYELGYNNWYVSEFYKFFHDKLNEISDIEFEYKTLGELSKNFNQELNNHYPTIFNWYNFIIYNPVNGKMFLHSWYDYAPEMLGYAINNNFNIVKFSCVSNLTDDIINKYSPTTIVQPSVYYLENWSDIGVINSMTNKKLKFNKVYFNGLSYGYRQNIMSYLSKYDFFDIKEKTKLEDYRQKDEYYDELSKYNFGLSLNGAAGICYRDLELFGLGVLNLRQKLNSKTYEPLLSNVHYIELINDKLTHDIIYNMVEGDFITTKVNELIEFSSTNEYKDMIEISKKWYLDNCLPENQFKIILSFFDDFDIFF